MKVKNANSGLLCNFEVMDLLRTRGADHEDLKSFGSVTPSECQVYEYLLQTPAGTQTRDSLQTFFKQCEQYNLTKAERLQASNLRPSTAVEIHMIIEDCEERMTADVVDDFLKVVDTLPKPPEKLEEEEVEGETMQEQDDGGEGDNEEEEMATHEEDEGDDDGEEMAE